MIYMKDYRELQRLNYIISLKIIKDCIRIFTNNKHDFTNQYLYIIKKPYNFNDE